MVIQKENVLLVPGLEYKLFMINKNVNGHIYKYLCDARLNIYLK